jgi:hypothetical protein
MAFTISTQFNVLEYSDLVVSCGPKQSPKHVYCHKAVVCSQSEWLDNECARAVTKADTVGGRTHITIHSHWDGQAVEDVLGALYWPRSEAVEWLQGLDWTELLRLFGVVSLFDQDDLKPFIQARVSEQVDQLECPVAILSASDHYAYHANRYLSYMDEHFGGLFGGLLEKARIQKQRGLKETMRMLQDPATRGEVSEEACQRFFAAVQCDKYSSKFWRDEPANDMID